MAPVRTKRIALVSTTVPNFKRRKDAGGGGGALAVNTSVTLEPTAEVSEDALEGDVVGTIVTQPEAAEIELLDDAGGRFVLDGASLLVGPTGFDFETAIAHTIVIRAVSGAASFDKPIVISVTNVVELTDVTLSNLTITENTAAGTVIGALGSVPSGATFGLLNDAGGRFAVLGSDLVAGATPTDYEASASHEIEVQAARGSETLSKTFTITVANVNELTAINLSNSDTPENATAPAVVGGLTSTPAGATFALIGNAGGRFALSGSNIVRGATALDYETATSHEITVRATRLGETLERTLTINVTNVNEIADITLSANTVEENTVAGVTIGALASVPAGATLSLTNTAGNRFALSGSNLVTGAVSTNYEAATSHDVTVQAVLGADTYTKTFTVDVTDVLEGFTVNLSGASIAENSAPGASVGTLTSNPSGATWSLVDGAGGRFAVSGDTVVTGSVATNYEAAASHTIEVRGTREGVDVDQSFTIAVTDVDEISNITLSNATIAENAVEGATVGTLTSTPGGATWQLVDSSSNRFALNGNNLVKGATALDYEAATSHDVTVRGTIGGETFEKSFTVSVSNVVEISDITLSPASVAESAGAGASVGTLSSTPAGASFTLIDNASGRFTLSGTSLTRGATGLDYEAATSHEITVRATRLGETFDKTITIAVTNVNELTGVGLTNASIAENAAATTVIGTLSSTPGGASFSLSDNAGGRVAISGANLVVGATGLNYEAGASIPFTVVASLGSDTLSQGFTLTVTDVDEINAIGLSNAAINENAAANTVVGTLSSTPAGASYALTADAGGRFAISGSNLVVGATGLNYETATSHTITVRGTRMGETFDQNFTITVNNVNEITNIALSGSSIPENSTAGAVVGTLSSTPAGASFSLSDNAGNRFAISGSNLVAGSVATDYEGATSHSVTVVATLGADTQSQAFTINVSDVNETPPALVPNNLSINPGNNSAFGATTDSPSTMNPNGSGSGTGYTYLWTIDSGTAVVLSPNTAATNFTAGPGSEGQGSLSSIARCTVTDSLGAQGSRTTQITLNN